MSQSDQIYFYDSEALLDRLTSGVRQSGREVVFVVGAPLTAPVGSRIGVADVAGVTDLIRQEFDQRPDQLHQLDAILAPSTNKYQEAFRYLIGRRGQDAANRVVKSAVFKAWLGANSAEPIPDWSKINDADYSNFENRLDAWQLSPGVAALGELVQKFPKVFGGLVITSNFDPLIEISIRKAGGLAWRTSLHSDGNINQSKAQGCQIVHIHGYWYGTDTLHTGNQLIQFRPSLSNSLLSYLEGKVIVVVAYGGWKDIFTNAIKGFLENTDLFPEVVWAFYEEKPELTDELRSTLAPGLSRGTVTLYSGVDCHSFFPSLFDGWGKLEALDGDAKDKNLETVGGAAKIGILARFILSDRRLDCDRPPAVDVWVGRKQELANLAATSARVVIVSGFGGEGKSVLAAKYLLSVDKGETVYKYWDWRDCKEEADRLRTQIVGVIERITSKELSAIDLQRFSDEDLVGILIDHSKIECGVFVFDNVDKYVDLENFTFVGILDILTKAFSRSDTKSRLVLTCRPNVLYDSSSIITIALKGLSSNEAVELFSKRVRGGGVLRSEIEQAREVTDGHAFWLDLLAVQVGRGDRKLKNLLEDIRRGREKTPDILSSVWEVLPERERLVLRAMAEIARPESEDSIFEIIAHQITFNKYKKAFRALLNVNMVVVKPELNSPDLFDLHPLVRQFLKKNFGRSERIDYIKNVIKKYSSIMSAFQSLMGVYLPYNVLERWTQKCDLEIEGAMYEDAFTTIDQVREAVVGSGHSEEYVRVARKLFESIDWMEASQKNPKFDVVLVSLIECLNHFEEYDAVDDLFRRFEETIPNKTARYIFYCDAKCNSEWTRGEYESAIHWGSIGHELKCDTQVDTSYDCENNLALARRDGGEPEEALKFFSRYHDIDQLTDPNASENVAEGHTFGNVGRCLQLMGELKGALVCYYKSAKILENDVSGGRTDNQSYARQWIAEIYEVVGDFERSRAFYVDAEALLKAFAPGRAREVGMRIDRLVMLGNLPPISLTAAQRIVGQWLRMPAPRLNQ